MIIDIEFVESDIAGLGVLYPLRTLIEVYWYVSMFTCNIYKGNNFFSCLLASRVYVALPKWAYYEKEFLQQKHMLSF